MTLGQHDTSDQDQDDQDQQLTPISGRRLVTLDPESRQLVATGNAEVGDVKVFVTVEAPLDGSGDLVDVNDLVEVFTTISLAASRASTAAVDFLAHGKLTDHE